MKKLLLSIAVAAALCASAVSCGGSAADATSSMKAKIENCTNTDSLKAYVDEARAYAEKLVKEGKIDEAKKYLEAIEPAVKAKAPALAGVLGTAETALDKAKDVAGDKAEEAREDAGEAVDSARAAVGSAVDAVGDKAADVYDATKEKATDVVNATKDKAGDVYDATKAKASEVTKSAADAVKEGADKAKELLK